MFDMLKLLFVYRYWLIWWNHFLYHLINYMHNQWTPNGQKRHGATIGFTIFICCLSVQSVRIWFIQLQYFTRSLSCVTLVVGFPPSQKSSKVIDSRSSRFQPIDASCPVSPRFQKWKSHGTFSKTVNIAS